MLARMEAWHWWIGIILTFGSIATVVALGVGYLANVSRPQHPGRRNRVRDLD